MSNDEKIDRLLTDITKLVVQEQLTDVEVAKLSVKMMCSSTIILSKFHNVPIKKVMMDMKKEYEDILTQSLAKQITKHEVENVVRFLKDDSA